MISTTKPEQNIQNSNVPMVVEIEENIKKITEIKPNLRSPEQKKEYSTLRKMRLWLLKGNETTQLDKEKDSSKRAAKRQAEDVRRRENENRKLRKQKLDEETAKVEQEKDRVRKEKKRENEIVRRQENENQKVEKTNVR